MNKIKVFLQYPWKFPDSQYYKYLIDFPPKKIEYLNVERQKGVITSVKKFKILTKIKLNIRLWTNRLGLIIPNAHLTMSELDYDLIHCAHCLSKNEDKPWVADIENVWSMWVSGMKRRKGIDDVRKILERENCKKIMPWTKYAYEQTVKMFPNLKEKIELVYPAIPMPRRNKKNKKITIIYVARQFWIKGGLVALETLRNIKKKRDVNVIFVSDVPHNIKKKYPDIEIKDLLPQNEIKELIDSAHIFFYPSMVDTFGFSLLEAMSHGLPVVALNAKYTKSIREIVEENKEGFIINYPGEPKYYQIGKREKAIIRKLENKLLMLIKNENLRKKMSKNCILKIKNGKFSMNVRNKKIMKIYSEAIK